MSESAKSTSISFRIDESILNKLKNEAKENDISLNTLANQVFKRYVEWDSFGTKVGMVPVAKPLLIELFSELDENRLAELADKIGKRVVNEVTMFVKGTLDEESFMKWFESRLRASPFEVNHVIQENGAHSFIIKHDMGIKWSTFHKMIIEQFFKTIKKDVDIDAQNNMFVVNFSL